MKVGCHMLRRSLLVSCAGLPIAAAARAQSFPTRSVHLIVGYTPGGGNDLVARIVAAKMQDKLGQTVIVENKPGAQSIVAAELVRLRVDVLVTSITQAAVAAKKATTTIPIVMVNVGDPVEIGLVVSLARPGATSLGCQIRVAIPAPSSSICFSLWCPPYPAPACW